MTIELVPLATFEVTGGAVIAVGAGPAGNRQVMEVTGFNSTGGRLSAHLKGAACADWATISPEGVVSLDVRATLETDDGAIIYVSYQGRANVADGLGAAVYCAPLFETADPRYLWLNTIQAVGKGAFADGVLRYEWYEVR